MPHHQNYLKITQDVICLVLYSLRNDCGALLPIFAGILFLFSYSLTFGTSLQPLALSTIQMQTREKIGAPLHPPMVRKIALKMKIQIKFKNVTLLASPNNENFNFLTLPLPSPHMAWASPASHRC